MRLETQLAQVGTKKEKKTGAISFPVYFATAYEHIGLGVSTGYDYSRTANPTRDVLEESIARLEGGDAGFACSSGMAAIQTVMGIFSKGDHLIVSLDLYGGTYRLFEEVLSRFGLTFSYVDLRDLDAVEQAVRPHTKAIFIETVTNPLMRVTDLAAICRIAGRHQLLSIVDNTFMTPYHQQPIQLGADIVIHSATKYLGGHNDVLAGLIVTKGEELSERIRFIHNSIGATLGPLDAWLLMRGMKTLALRMEKHQENASQLARFLHEHPGVTEVFYPELDEKSRSILSEQGKGCGGMLSFRVKNKQWIGPFLENLKIITFAESLGGVESLITYPATQTHADIPQDIREKVGVCERLLRFSAGIEHVDDLKQDLANAFAQAERTVNQGGRVR
ncbi:aminotransferase class I/II-fold pyridoxal phosphate-dependent enzyme [Paenactinomyces guangxiensis]|uniref:Aminotransferase class V-fold PLP-dependent enzyme n=1 Tax=Paenactinomyces guangxiensis TaxID=1490290 RepID=A0A7W2A7F5_9BACL|nr:aminotransferase class I/II-fold pyridoxal phosphate-dependent enzyme [Paenactinomyces guangxiensis]MBA4493084.1 aminotransferase class V-fold PLP-dependent enzyme [Paenactinomyces guangxiensis]MBH8590066.1 aminotransferase class V-fold PLP-dependent enzyme [Paenactinomyces guangxiensis]